MSRIASFMFSLCAVVLVLGLSSNALAKEVNGTVTDKESGEPIFGATIQVKGTNIGAITNDKGEWSIPDVPHEDYVLIIRMMGYKQVEVKATGGVIHAELEVSMFNVGEVVTTATGKKQLYEDVPVKTEVVPKHQIEVVEEADLYGVLQYTPGVRVENNCQNCSFTQLRLLGLEGGYTQILIDGAPVVSTMAGVYGLQQFPEQMIDKLEVVKGGGSALYGGNAIGGVVNIRLKRPMLNQSSTSFRYRLGDGHVRSEAGFVSEAVSDDQKFGIFFYGNARKQNGYDRNDDGFTDIGRLSAETLGLSAFRKVSDKGELSASLHRIQEDRRGGNKLSLPSHQADISEAAESSRWGGSVSYLHHLNRGTNIETLYAFALADRDTYYGAGQDPNAYGRTKNPVHYASFKFNKDHGIHSLTAGVTYKSEDIFDEAVAYNRTIDDTYSDTGFILQDQIELKDRYTLVAGVRVDKHSLLDDPIISPRLSAMMDVTSDWKLRGTVSTGFKAPQVFDEDLHITQVNGEGQIIRNNDDLEEEKSLSFSGTASYMGMLGAMPAQFGLTGFHTQLDDQFQIVENDNPLTSAFEFERQNGDGLKVSGLELQGGLKPHDAIELQGSFTFQTDELDSKEPDFNSTRLFRTPEQYGNIMAFLNYRENTNVFFGINYTGEMKAPHYAGYIATDKLETTDAFVSLDLGLTYCFHNKSGNKKTTLSIGVKNLMDEYQDDLDKNIDRDAGYMYGPATPRMFYSGIEFAL